MAKIKKIKDYFSTKDDEEKAKIVKADSAYCENCGHRQWLWGEDKIICTHCGTLVFRNDKIRFKHRLKEKMAKQRRSQ